MSTNGKYTVRGGKKALHKLNSHGRDGMEDKQLDPTTMLSVMKLKEAVDRYGKYVFTGDKHGLNMARLILEGLGKKVEKPSRNVNEDIDEVCAYMSEALHIDVDPMSCSVNKFRAYQKVLSEKSKIMKEQNRKIKQNRRHGS